LSIYTNSALKAKFAGKEQEYETAMNHQAKEKQSCLALLEILIEEKKARDEIVNHATQVRHDAEGCPVFVKQSTIYKMQHFKLIVKRM